MNNNYFEKCHLLMNKLSKQNKQLMKLQIDFADLEKENEQLKQSNKWLRANRKDCEKGQKLARKQWQKFDKMRIKRIQFLEKKLKDNNLSIYEYE